MSYLVFIFFWLSVSLSKFLKYKSKYYSKKEILCNIELMYIYVLTWIYFRHMCIGIYMCHQLICALILSFASFCIGVKDYYFSYNLMIMVYVRHSPHSRTGTENTHSKNWYANTLFGVTLAFIEVLYKFLKEYSPHLSEHVPKMLFLRDCELVCPAVF